MKFRLLLLMLLAAPVFADSNKIITPQKDSEIGRYEFHAVHIGTIPIYFKFDTKTGETWKLEFNTDVGDIKTNVWYPILTIDHKVLTAAIEKAQKK